MSDLTLNFKEKLKYPHNKQGITVKVALRLGNETPVSVETKLDTGSTFCVFQPQYARMLGIEIENGEPEVIITATGKFIAYGHEVILQIANFEIEATVYFVTDELFPVSVLGRIGFLDRLQIGLIDYEQLLFIDSLENYYQ